MGNLQPLDIGIYRSIQKMLKYVEGNRKKKDLDETTIIAGGPMLSEQKAKDSMTLFCETFVIDIYAKLDGYWIVWSEQEFH
jgi:hypothetical protein